MKMVTPTKRALVVRAALKARVHPHRLEIGPLMAGGMPVELLLRALKPGMPAFSVAVWVGAGLQPIHRAQVQR